MWTFRTTSVKIAKMCNAEKLAAYLDGCVRGEFSYDADKDAFVYTRDRFVYICPVRKAGVACEGRFLITSKMLAWVITTNLIKDAEISMTEFGLQF